MLIKQHHYLNELYGTHGSVTNAHRIFNLKYPEDKISLPTAHKLIHGNHPQVIPSTKTLEDCRFYGCLLGLKSPTPTKSWFKLNKKKTPDLTWGWLHAQHPKTIEGVKIVNGSISNKGLISQLNYLCETILLDLDSSEYEEFDTEKLVMHGTRENAYFWKGYLLGSISQMSAERTIFNFSEQTEAFLRSFKGLKFDKNYNSLIVTKNSTPRIMMQLTPTMETE